ncbi:hypothetical protein Tco_0526359 [Tanacetum coccineum]
MPNPLSLTPYVPPTKKDLDILFQPMFDEYFNPPPSVVSPVPVVVAPKPADPTSTPYSTSIDQDALMCCLIMEYLVNISKRRAFWSLNEDILKINDSDNQYAVSIKEDTAFNVLGPRMKSPPISKNGMQEVILFYNGLGIPTRQILNSRGAIPSKTVADAKIAIQEMVEYSQKWHLMPIELVKTAKAVEKRFGGNAATKKTQRNLLKQ